jgi:hypothetical protein
VESTSEIALARRGRADSATAATSTGLADAASPRPATLRSRVTNNPSYLAGTVTPRAQARRHRDLIRTFIAALGGPDAVSDLTLITVRKAAELTVAAERARAVLLTSSSIGPNDLEMLTRLEGEARRAVRALGLPDAGKRVKSEATPPWSPLRAALLAKAAKEPG